MKKFLKDLIACLRIFKEEEKGSRQSKNKNVVVKDQNGYYIL